MLFNRLIAILPLAAIILVAWILLSALVTTSHEAKQWPRRLARFLVALIAGLIIFAVVYIAGGLIVSTLGYDYYDKPLLRLAHLVCIIGIYPAAMTSAAIFRTKHTALLLGILLVLAVHLWDRGTYLGRMVFDDPAIPLNGDFALTNMALMLVCALLGGEVALKRALKPTFLKSQRAANDIEAVRTPSLTSGEG